MTEEMLHSDKLDCASVLKAPALSTDAQSKLPSLDMKSQVGYS
jgi:hypothetical protein